MHSSKRPRLRAYSELTVYTYLYIVVSSSWPFGQAPHMHYSTPPIAAHRAAAETPPAAAWHWHCGPALISGWGPFGLYCAWAGVVVGVRRRRAADPAADLDAHADPDTGMRTPTVPGMPHPRLACAVRLGCICTQGPEKRIEAHSDPAGETPPAADVSI